LLSYFLDLLTESSAWCGHFRCEPFNKLLAVIAQDSAARLMHVLLLVTQFGTIQRQMLMDEWRSNCFKLSLPLLDKDIMSLLAAITPRIS
jgi:hypothetical protein